MPRMQLVVAAISVKISVLRKRELQMNYYKEMFWTDSEVTSDYIKNESKKFKLFVTNRIKLISEHSEVEQWDYVNTRENPVEYVCREISMDNSDKVEQWILRLKFLWEPEDNWNTNTKTPVINPEDPELKADVYVSQIFVLTGVFSVLETQASTCSKIVRIVALMMLFVRNFKTKMKQGKMKT